MDTSVSGIGVLDKVIRVLEAVEARPLALGELVVATGLPRASAHRLAVAAEAHGLLRRTPEGRFALGLRLVALGRAASDGVALVEVARPALEALRAETGESVQLYVREADQRVCVASLESPHGLRTIVRVGETLPLERGSAGRVLRSYPVLVAGEWAESVEEREAGVASVSAAVHGAAGEVVAAVGVSGPVERTSRSPGRRYGPAVVRAALAVETAARYCAR
ncbi:MAG: IclR family transcriptional regulator [Acidimicrobiales bacterium]